MASTIWRTFPQVVRMSCKAHACRTPLGLKVTRSEFVVTTPILRMVSSSSKKSSTPSTVSVPEKTPYEVELERLKKGRNEEYYGFFEDEPVLDKITFHGLMFFGFSVFCVFTVAMVCYTPMFRGKDKKWIDREARWQMEKRRAAGLPLISANYAPEELVESMVPPAGEWEKEWLSNQPTTKPICTDLYGQNNQF